MATIKINEAINSRSLTYESNNLEELATITPAMFLTDRITHDLPDCDTIDKSPLCRKMKYQQKLRKDLRLRFCSEYLEQLKLFYAKKSARDIKLGEIVLVESENEKRLNCLLARVVEILPGKDNHIRLVRLKTARGTLLTPIQRLYHLKCLFNPVTEESAVPVQQCSVDSIEEVTPRENDSDHSRSAGVNEKSRVPVTVTRSDRKW